MTVIKRNLWILITLSTVFIIAQNWISNANKATWEKRVKNFDERVQTPRSCFRYDVELNTNDSQNPAIDAFISTSVKPEPVNLDEVKNRIGYPAEAFLNEIEGTVIVRVLVDEQGNYVKHKTIKVGHAVLSEAIDNEIHRIGFLPAVKNGKPVKCWVNIPFSFRLAP